MCIRDRAKARHSDWNDEFIKQQHELCIKDVGDVYVHQDVHEILSDIEKESNKEYYGVYKALTDDQ